MKRFILIISLLLATACILHSSETKEEDDDFILITVMGAVEKPFKDRIFAKTQASVISALRAAKGHTRIAELNEIYLVLGRDNNLTVRKVNLKELVEKQQDTKIRTDCIIIVSSRG